MEENTCGFVRASCFYTDPLGSKSSHYSKHYPAGSKILESTHFPVPADGFLAGGSLLLSSQKIWDHKG